MLISILARVIELALIAVLVPRFGNVGMAAILSGYFIVSIGFIEGAAEGMISLARIASGLASDLIGRRKPLVLLGYEVPAFNKVMFPLGASSLLYWWLATSSGRLRPWS